ncbi:MAG: hypothetical protein NVSMB51_21380 [Solirubrobacteraceae bacterium]
MPIQTRGTQSAKRGGSEESPMNQAAMTAFGPQHMRALQRANEVRLARAGLKRAVAQGEVRAAEVILDCPWQAETMTVGDLLTSQRRWGRTRCRKFLSAIPLSETKAIGTLTERQRRALANALNSIAGPTAVRRAERETALQVA